MSRDIFTRIYRPAAGMSLRLDVPFLAKGAS